VGGLVGIAASGVVDDANRRAARLGTLSRRAEQVGEDQNPDHGAEQLLQKWRLQKDQRDHQEAEKRDHRLGDVLMLEPLYRPATHHRKSSSCRPALSSYVRDADAFTDHAGSGLL
jgi:hypothetical protein